jgi:hypothetical protein
MELETRLDSQVHGMSPYVFFSFFPPLLTFIYDEIDYMDIAPNDDERDSRRVSSPWYVFFSLFFSLLTFIYDKDYVYI